MSLKLNIPLLCSSICELPIGEVRLGLASRLALISFYSLNARKYIAARRPLWETIPLENGSRRPVSTLHSRCRLEFLGLTDAYNSWKLRSQSCKLARTLARYVTIFALVQPV